MAECVFSHHANSFGVNQILLFKTTSNLQYIMEVVCYCLCFVQTPHPVATLNCLRIMGGCFGNEE